jgi:hypothetical protein
MDPDILNNMMARVERCRLIARETTDERAARALLQIAAEGRADIARLFAQSRAEPAAENRSQRLK